MIFNIPEQPLNLGGKQYGVMANYQEAEFGSGNSVLRIDSEGFYMGNARYADAPVKIAFDGKFTFGSESGSKYIKWDGSAMTIRGSLNADDITAGTLTGRTVRSTSGNGRIELTNGDRLYFYDGSGNIQGTMYGDADDLRVYAADDVHIGAGNAAVIKVGQSHISPISTDMTYDIGDSSHYFDRVYAHAYSTEAGLGTDTDFTIISAIDDEVTDGVVTNVRYKTQAISVSGGIIIGVGAQSDWIDA